MIQNSKLNNKKKINNRHGNFNKNYINCNINNICIQISKKKIIDDPKKEIRLRQRSVLDIQNLLKIRDSKYDNYSQIGECHECDKNEIIVKDSYSGSGSG